MKLKLLYISFIFFGLSFRGWAQLLPNLGGQRTGSSALTFLKNDASPRSLGMAGANVTLKEDGYASFMNPAATATVKGLDFSTSNYFHGVGIQQTFLASTLPFSGNGSAINLSINNLASGKQEVRTEFQPEGTGEFFYVVNTAVGLGYAKKLSDQFSFGLNFKYIHESLAQYKNSTVAADLGFLYNTDVRELSFAVAVLNFGGSSVLNGDHQEVSFTQNPPSSAQSYPVPTVFKLGISMVPYHKKHHKIMTAIQLNHPNDNSENLRFGVEYSYRKMLFMRAGYILGRKSFKYPTAGVGYRARIGNNPLHINYSFVPTRIIGAQHSIGFALTILKTEERTTGDE